MDEKYIGQLFLQEKPTRIILTINSLGKTYTSIIANEIKSTFAHTTNILYKMEERELVKFTSEGRIKYIELTEQGLKVANALELLISELGAKFQPNETDTVSLQEKINKLRLNLEVTYRKLKESGANKTAIIEGMLPFNNEIKLLDNTIEDLKKSSKKIDELILISLKDVKVRFELIISS
ncbi:MAG: MarR family transcriptional regulator [Methanosarcinaceae archaeon]|nr:MarR family transcriptional regulator [Methanosarcinaceae archaeon]